MPPKPKFSKQEITEAAYELMESNGIDSVVAREVAKKLGCTTAPIFTFYGSMDELRDDVYQMALGKCSEYLNGCIDYAPAFKEFGLRWIRFAKEHPQAYMLVFMLKGTQKQTAGSFMNIDFIQVISPMTAEICNTFKLSENDAKQLINDMCVYAQGIASMMVNGVGDFREDEISRGISRTCLSYVAGLKLLDGSFEVERMKHMFLSEDKLPVRKSELKNQTDTI